MCTSPRHGTPEAVFSDAGQTPRAAGGGSWVEGDREVGRGGRLNLHLAYPWDDIEQKEGPRRSCPHIMLAVGGQRLSRDLAFWSKRGSKNGLQHRRLCVASAGAAAGSFMFSNFRS